MNWRRLGKSLGAVVVSVLFTDHSRAISFPEPKCRYDAQEILWFSTVRSNLVAVFGSGLVGVWDFLSGELRAQTRIAHEDLVYPGNHLALSQGPPMILAAIAPRERIENDKVLRSLVLYDLLKPQRKEIWVELVSPASSGFIGTGSGLVLADTPPSNPAVLALDTSTTKPIWRSETEDDVQTGTIVVRRGKCYCHDRTLRARDNSGKLLWNWQPVEGKFAEPGYWPDTPSLPYVVVYESDLDSDQAGDLLALAADSGQIVWRKQSAKFGSLKAISRDGKHQAFCSNGRIQLTELPKRNSRPVSAVKGDVDAMFSSEGRLLLCLPGLVKVSENKAENSYMVARASKLLSVLDFETGKLVKQIALTVPTPPRNR